MILNDLIESALISGRLQKEAEAMPGDERFFFLDLVSRAASWENTMEDDRDDLICIPYAHAGMRFCFLAKNQFDMIFLRLGILADLAQEKLQDEEKG